MKDYPSEITSLNVRIFEIEASLSEMITMNINLTEMLKKEMISSSLRAKRIIKLLGELEAKND